jgi:hypothetical protein
MRAFRAVLIAIAKEWPRGMTGLSEELKVPRSKLYEWRDGQRRELELNTVERLGSAASQLDTKTPHRRRRAVLGHGLARRLARALRPPRAGGPDWAAPRRRDDTGPGERDGFAAEEVPKIVRAGKRKESYFIRGLVLLSEEERERCKRDGHVFVERLGTHGRIGITSELYPGEVFALPDDARRRWELAKGSTLRECFFAYARELAEGSFLFARSVNPRRGR